jgi:prepilin-type N-terminal cleavage/methylation domain-containing protein
MMRLMRRQPHPEAGFTLVEIMITSTLLLIVVAMVLPLVVGSLNAFTNTQVRSDAVDSAQLAFTQISHDVISGNLLYLDSGGTVHLQSYGGGGSSTCVEYRVQYPTAPAAQVADLLRRTKSPGNGATGWPTNWSTVMTGIVNSSQAIVPPAVTAPAVFAIPSASASRSLAVNLFVQLDTRSAATAASAENYTSTFTGPAIRANAPATADPGSQPC